MLLFKNVWNNYDAIYAIDRNSKLLVMWSESEADKPGYWLKNVVHLNYSEKISRYFSK